MVSGLQYDRLEGEVVKVRYNAKRNAFDAHPGFEIVVTDGVDIADRNRENKDFTANLEMGKFDPGNRLSSINHLHFLLGLHGQAARL